MVFVSLYFNNIHTQLRKIPLNDPFEIISEVRPGKKLLVLDIDGTIYNDSSLRPGLHNMLARVNDVRTIFVHICNYFSDYFKLLIIFISFTKHYDIAICSATSVSRIKTIMREEGLVGDDLCNIVFILDLRSIIRVSYLNIENL